MWVAMSTSSRGCARRVVDEFFCTRLYIQVTSYELLVDMRGEFLLAGHGLRLNVGYECAESRSLVFSPSRLYSPLPGCTLGVLIFSLSPAGGSEY